MVNFERALLEYRKNPTVAPFDIKSVSFVVAPAAGGSSQGAGKGKGPSGPGKGPAAPVAVKEQRGEDKQEMYAAMLASVPQFSGLK